MTKIAYFDGRRGHLAYRRAPGLVEMVETTVAHPGRYIRVDDGHNYPQLCEGGGRYGVTLSWRRDETETAEGFARDCGARLYMTRYAFDRALEAMNRPGP